MEMYIIFTTESLIQEEGEGILMHILTDRICSQTYRNLIHGELKDKLCEAGDKEKYFSVPPCADVS